MGKSAVGALVILLAPVCRAEVAYLGSQVCAGCHKKIYDSYERTAMGRSISVPAASNISQTVTVFYAKWNRYFQVFREGEGLYQAEYEKDSTGNIVFATKHKIEYAVGSGVNGMSYIVRRGDYLFQAPLSFYSRTGRWDLSPGYEFADLGFSRAIPAACVACHSGQPQPVTERDGMYRDPPFRELAIGCENCHGPAKRHVTAPGKETIVNPARLPARLAEDICANCHQGGDARILQPGKTYSDFRPGSWLNETLAIIRVPGAEGEEDLLEHHSSMQSSKCYIASKGKLSCLTCHDPHLKPAGEEAASYYRSKCFTCHANTACKLPVEARARQGRSNDCAECHMPKRNVSMVAHSALTNHRIVRHPGQPRSDPLKADPSTGLIHVNRPPNGGPLPAMTLLKAYGEVIEKHPEYQERYLALLDELAKRQPGDPFLQAALGRRALREGKPDQNQKAIEHLARAIELGFAGPTAYEDLAEALSRAGRLAEAVEALKRGIALNPYTQVLYKSLALRYITLKQYPLAKETMKTYVKLFPEDGFMRGLLKKVE